MSRNPKGKHVSIDPSRPEALGVCDYSRFICMKKDLVKQMEWRGNALIWTGWLVHPNYLDVPNEQLRAPILPPDPVPVANPRLQQGEYFLCSYNQLPICSQINWAPNTLFGPLLVPLNPEVQSGNNTNVLNNPTAIPENTPMPGMLANDEPVRLSNLRNFNWNS